MGFLDSQQKNYIERRLKAGASDNRIAVELANPASAADKQARSLRPARISAWHIATMRKELDIPSVAAMQTAAIIDVAAKKKKKKPVEAFNDAAREDEPDEDAPDAPVQENDQADDKKPKVPLPAFTLVMAKPETLRKNDIYVIERLGAFRFEGVKDVPITGVASPKIAQFKPLHATVSIGVPLDKLAERGVRLAASLKYFEELFAVMEKGGGEMKIPRARIAGMKFYERIQTERDVSKIMAVAREAYKNKGNDTGITFARSVVESVASEYAAVSKMKIEAARGFVGMLVGKPFSKAQPSSAPKKEHY